MQNLPCFQGKISEHDGQNVQRLNQRVVSGKPQVWSVLQENSYLVRGHSVEEKNKSFLYKISTPILICFASFNLRLLTLAQASRTRGLLTTSPKFIIRKCEHFETLPLAYKRHCQCHKESKVSRMIHGTGLLLHCVTWGFVVVILLLLFCWYD